MGFRLRFSQQNQSSELNIISENDWLVVWNIFYFSHHIGNFIIPTDCHIFQRGRYTTNQYIYIYNIAYTHIYIYTIAYRIHHIGKWAMRSNNLDEILGVLDLEIASDLHPSGRRPCTVSLRPWLWQAPQKGGVENRAFLSHGGGKQTVCYWTWP